MTIWIGRVEPSLWLEGLWWHQVLPSDVRLAVLSLGVRRLTDTDLERAHAQILEKVETLDAEGVDVINVGGSPVVGIHGLAGHDRLLQEIAIRTSRPFVTALQAELEGIRAVGGSRVLVASPYPARLTERRVQILEEAGFAVAGHDSLEIERTFEITQLDPARVVQQVIELVGRHPEGDVVYLPCGSLPVMSVIERIEVETARPVVTCVQSQVRATLTRAAYDRPIQGYGRLLRSLGPVLAA